MCGSCMMPFTDSAMHSSPGTNCVRMCFSDLRMHVCKYVCMYVSMHVRKYVRIHVWKPILIMSDSDRGALFGVPQRF